MKEILDRFSAPTPEFWKKVRAAGLWLMGLSGVIMGIKTQFPEAHIPDLIYTISTYSAVIGFVLSGAAQLTVKDTTTTPDDVK